MKTINVGWIGKSELGNVECEVVERWPDAEARPRTARYNKGKTSEVSWCASQERYVFVPLVNAARMEALCA